MSERPPVIHLRVPGDKSISHRALLLAALAPGESRLSGLSTADDVRATARCLRSLGAPIPELVSSELRCAGAAWQAPEGDLDCGNSGTTARLLLGLVAGLGLPARLDGDASLRRRPMDRVVYPLQAMGARIRYGGAPDRLPVVVERRASGSLRPLRHRPAVASAQVKSCMLLAGLASHVRVEICEPSQSRDHTERLLGVMGCPTSPALACAGHGLVLDPIDGAGALRPLDLDVPGDPSSAAFLLAAGLLGQTPVRTGGVGLNPTRTGFIRAVEAMGGRLTVEPSGDAAGEPAGDIAAAPSELGPLRIDGGQVPGLLDEIPILAVLASRARGESIIRGAGELRVKESDRLRLLARNLSRLGVECEELDDGLRIVGSGRALAGGVETGGDHRIAMAFGVLGSRPGNEIEVDDPACVTVSYPRFWEDLASIRSGGAK
ncbi:MAG: 3-phosphoshikimate 1-carboxyvinyltransferase [Gemmatimonadota bacterium]